MTDKDKAELSHKKAKALGALLAMPLLPTRILRGVGTMPEDELYQVLRKDWVSYGRDIKDFDDYFEHVVKYIRELWADYAAYAEPAKE